MSAKLQPGMTLPDFELPDENGDLHRLSELQGNDPMMASCSAAASTARANASIKRS